MKRIEDMTDEEVLAKAREYEREQEEKEKNQFLFFEKEKQKIKEEKENYLKKGVHFAHVKIHKKSSKGYSMTESIIAVQSTSEKEIEKMVRKMERNIVRWELIEILF